MLRGRTDLRPFKAVDHGLWCYALQKEPFASRYPFGCLGYYLSDAADPNHLRLCEVDRDGKCGSGLELSCNPEDRLNPPPPPRPPPPPPPPPYPSHQSSHALSR